jgi:repressor LexA
LTLTEKGGELLENTAQPCPKEDTNEIRLLGKIAAGQPLEAIEDEQTLTVSDFFKSDNSTFALQVTGESMKDEGIFDGDYVICRQADTARNGQLVVAIVDKDNATLKRFYKERDCIRLQPANSDFEPIYTKNCRIQAVAVGLIRNSV